MAVKHSTVATLPDEAGKEVNKAEWNDDHTVDDNTFVAAKLSATAENKLFGRSTAGAGAGEEITAGTGVITALGVNVGSAGAFVTFNGDGGTPSSLTLTNATGLPIAGGGTGAATAQAAAAALKVPYILAHSAVAATAPADTAENTLATITIPANAMGANGLLRVTTGWTVTNSANGKTLRGRFSAIGGTIYMSLGITTQATVKAQFEIHNRNATNSQVGGGSGNPGAGMWGQQTGAIVTSAVDTTASTTIVITGQKALAGETITLEWYLVELILP